MGHRGRSQRESIRRCRIAYALRRGVSMRIDAHVHLQPHGERPVVDRARIERYVEHARANGVDVVVFTEHLFRFQEAYDLLKGWWNADPNPALAAATEVYWLDHVN